MRYIYLLVGNYEKGDEKLLLKAIKCIRTQDRLHSLVFGLIDIYRHNRTKLCKEPIEAMYSKLTCGLHRTDLVEILIENGVLSDKIKEESRFDSYQSTRELVRGM